MKSSTANSPTRDRQAGWARWLTLGGLFALMSLALWYFPVELWLQSARTWVSHHDVIGAVVFVVGFAVGSALLIPGSVLMMTGGFLFGLWQGIVWVVIGAMFGSILGALVSRTLLRESLQRKFSLNPTFRALDGAIASRAFVIVVLTRLSLLIPYNVLNLMYGLTRVPLTTLGVASAVGLVPAAALYVYLGTLVNDAGQLFSGQQDQGMAGYALLIVGLLSLVAVTLLIHRTATRALKKELAAQSPSSVAATEA